MKIITDWVEQNFDKVVILPFLGEFGYFLTSFVPAVNALSAKEIIVCCREGEEIYFPKANGFFHTWTDPFQDHERCCFRDTEPISSPKNITVEESLLYATLQVSYSDYAFLRLDFPISLNDAMKSDICFKTNYSVPTTDVIVCARKRMAYRIGTQIPGRNYSHWQYILDELKSNSLSIGQAGHQSTSFQLNVNVRAWDFENVTEATVALMQATTVIIGTDTGLSHLAALLSKPLICFRKEDGSPNMLERFAIPYLQQKKQEVTYVRKGWDNPFAIVEATLEMLARVT